MIFQVLTLFPKLIQAMTEEGVIGQAIKSGKLQIAITNPRDFTTDNHKSVDDRPFGGGDGMLMMAEPLMRAFESLEEKGEVIYLSPKGQLLNDQMVQKLAKHKTLTLICGRYGGIDQRFLNKVSATELSIGDYVLSGGELAAGVLIDAVGRFQEGVLGDETSATSDSITMGWFEAPAYTRPREWQEEVVPEVLLSGHHEKMTEWKMFVGGLLTFVRRPDLLKLPELPRRQKLRWIEFARQLQEDDKKNWGLEGLDVEKFAQYLEKL